MSFAVQLMIITLFSKVLGLVRELIFGYFLGTSATKDVYVMATLVPLLLSSFILNSVTAAFIPRFNSVRKGKGIKEARRFTANVSNILAVISIVIIFLVIVFAVPIASFLAQGWEGEMIQETALYIRIVVLSILPIAFNSAFSGYLNVHDDFFSPSITVAVNNVVLIVFCFFAAMTGNWLLLPIGYTVAYFAQYIHYIPALKKTGYRHVPDFQWNNQLKFFFLLAAPILISVAATDLAQVIDKMIATALFETGGVSSMDYASKLITMVSGIIIASGVTAVYPKLSKLVQEKKEDDYHKEVAGSIESIYFFVIPVAVGLFILAEPIIQVVFERGAFNRASTILTGGLLRFYSLSLIGETIYILITRVFYSVNDTKTPIRIMLVQVLFDIPLNFLLSSLIGINGLALSSSIGMMAAGIYAIICYKKRFPTASLRAPIKGLVKMALAAAIMGLAVVILWSFFINLNIVLRIGLVTLLAMLLYFALTYVLQVRESRHFIGRFIK